ncbi:hypothetical protein ACP43V_10095 [Vibrio genomosp. F10 str. 9ZC157]|uniref:Uncharacterized protein n=1 Tax=Vibrio genomosp. F10 str. ZF-129 TaxID=1187848 RepID=A0A1E5BH53_9VIBR|nr:hypothetical protein [Vibrio genomosp. F10]OEE36124.1 hypothetical protein A1QO_19150 [Vibrio genomosp. F10 str. ZF-129]OEE95266.1 hypothetical protein A1QM_18075 [Vibrio genomosp. F10 str. 9ZC157]
MTESQKKWLKRWEEKRRKGFIHYIMIQTLMIGGGLFTGKLIGVALFTNQNQWGEFFTSIPITSAMILAVCIPLNSLAWFVSDKRYQSLTNQQNNT